VLAALVAASSAGADPLRYGVADDWPKFHPCGDIWWTSAKDIGYQDLRMTIQWDAAATTVIPFQSNLQDAIDCAKLNDIRPILSIYPAKASAIGSSDSAQTAFASFIGLVGQAFPDVTDFIVGNEPNVNRFWQPQYVNGRDAAATDYEHTLAKSYDALKVTRPDAIVWGPSISSRGNDNANASSNPSHSPVWFIKSMGDAYRASGRTSKIFDEFNLHPYPPLQDTDPFSKPFHWPQAGAANLDRIKQALWDAFHGTGQPTVTEQTGGKLAAFAAPQALPINLDEAGEQTVVTGHEPAYDGTLENVVPISEAQQSTDHVELAEIAACDPAVKTLLFFPLIDDTGSSSGFQSGNLFADLTRKQSYAGVKNKIASAGGFCQGGVPGSSQSWSHTEKVIGAADSFGGPGTRPGSQPANKPASAKYWAFSFTARESATYKATLSSVTARGGSARPVLFVVGNLSAYSKPLVKFNGQTLPVGFYQYSVTLAAKTNPQRTTMLTSRPFKVGAPAASSATVAKAKQKTLKGLSRATWLQALTKPWLLLGP
jgi:hypothetical protein